MLSHILFNTTQFINGVGWERQKSCHGGQSDDHQRKQSVSGWLLPLSVIFVVTYCHCYRHHCFRRFRLFAVAFIITITIFVATVVLSHLPSSLPLSFPLSLSLWWLMPSVFVIAIRLIVATRCRRCYQAPSSSLSSLCSLCSVHSMQ